MTDQEINALILNLGKLQPNRWYKTSGREDVIEVVKLLIDCHKFFGGDEYVISNDYSSFMRKINFYGLLPWHQMELSGDYKIKSRTIGKGFVWERQLLTIHEIYFKKELIAIETA